MNPTISIILPMYKTPFPLLRRSIDSVLNQSYQDYELLVIDDGSGKDYDELKREYEEKDIRVRFIEKENGGVASARNCGIENSRGEYISFVDSDDYIDEYFIEGLYKAIDGCELSICGVSEVYYPCNEGLIDKEMFFSLPSIYSGLQYINFSVNKLYRSDIIKGHNLRFPLNVKLGEDSLFLAQYYKYCSKIRGIPQCRYNYCINYDSAVRTYKPEYWSWETQVIKADWELFHQYNLSYSENVALMYWLYEKMMGASRYYFEFEENKKELDRILQIILDNEFIKQLFECDLSTDYKHFEKIEKKVVKDVKKYGVKALKRHLKSRKYLNLPGKM